MMRRFARAVLLAAAIVGTASAGSAAAAEAYLRVVDVGNGLCVVGRIPGGHSFLYDAGYSSDLCVRAVRELVPENEEIDLVVLSHSDADHITDVPDILRARRARTILHPGDNRPAGPRTPLGRARRAIAAATETGTTEINLASSAIPPGRVFNIGGGTATFVAGWSDGNQARGSGEGGLEPSERNNALSIVIRFQYGGHSVLLTGDTIGRRRNDPNSACRNAERIMRDRAAAHPIASEVLIGQHHGGNNGTANCFIRAVQPRYVVFSAGSSGHGHPRQEVADRLVANAVLPDNIFRTDRGDNEGHGEWIYGALAGCNDRPGDDDVEIFLPENPSTAVRVQYRTPSTGC